MLQETISRSEKETSAFAAEFAASLPASQIIFLDGPLGAGKSVFARALIRALTGEAGLAVPSPTFNLLQIYETSKSTIWHYDLYRLKDPDEMEELSWDDALAGGVVLVEWPERLGDLKPQGITIHIAPVTGDDNARTIRIENHAS